MSIMTRFVSLCKADIHSAIDQLEDKGQLLKQYLRDMEEALDHKELQLKNLIASQEQLTREERHDIHEIEKLEQDVIAAIQKEQDGIARILLQQKNALTHHREEVGHQRAILEERIEQSRACLTDQRFRYQQIRLRVKAYLCRADHEKWDNMLFPALPSPTIQKPSEEEIDLELLQYKEILQGGISQ